MSNDKKPPRVFEDRPAVREKTPLFIGLVGPSGSGKTFSAMRLASGIQRVSGGEIFGIDTEARRMLHYADRFKFRHVSFGAPFSPLDYLAAIDHCINKGASVVVIDSMSHEHEGPGGVLEAHEDELDRMAGNDWKKRDALSLLAWDRAKRPRRRLINSMLQRTCNFIFCFRAKEKIKPVKGGQPEKLGWMPIAGGEYIYEMTAKFWLHPGANGVPSWQSEHEAEQAMMKKPEQFRALFERSSQLSEDVGEQMARWASGAQQSSAALDITPDDLVRQYAACSDPATLRTLEDARGALWSKLGKADKERVKTASADAAARVASAERFPEAGSAGPPDVAEQEEIARQEREQNR